MSGVGRGLPLLSGPPPPVGSNNAEIACRKCNKEFNVIFARLKRCNHCGERRFSVGNCSRLNHGPIP